MGEEKRISVKKSNIIPVVSNPVKIRKYYDSVWEVWVIYPVDANGYQIDNCFYAHSKAEANDLEKELKEILGIGQ